MRQNHPHQVGGVVEHSILNACDLVMLQVDILYVGWNIGNMLQVAAVTVQSCGVGCWTITLQGAIYSLRLQACILPPASQLGQPLEGAVPLADVHVHHFQQEDEHQYPHDHLRKDKEYFKDKHTRFISMLLQYAYQFFAASLLSASLVSQSE